MDYEEYVKLPELLKNSFQNHVMVAIPGKKSAWLNPRINLDYFNKESGLIEFDQLETSALAIEKIWDEAEYLPEVISKAPEKEIFNKNFSKEALPFIKWNDSFNAEEALKEVEERYYNRLALDNGHI